jgi:hypothetical protein
MQKTLKVFGTTLLLLIALDVMVGLTLGWAERTNRLGALVQYFEYGRSVPGKLARWEANPGTRGNLYDVAWRPDLLAHSRAKFLAETGTDIAAEAPVIRSYGMSFVNNIIRNAIDIRPDLVWDGHAGPGVPPNFTFAVFEDDRENRRAGDIAVLGILSSAIPALAAHTNSTWAFEQPAPFTYPIYRPGEEGLLRIEPLVDSAADQRALRADAAARRAWYDQLARNDLFYSLQTFGLPWLDRSPFLRLVRRSLATAHIEDTKAAVLAGAYPYREVLRRMIEDFARIARADGQYPIVMLIQTRDPRDPDVLDIARPVLQRADIPYLATVEHFDPRDPSGFLGDGHYTPEIDRLFARQFLELLPQ